MATTPAAVACRLLPDSVADGPWQMAADEVMLESAAAGTASLRFYRWSVPTLSLGYFQPEAVRHSDNRLADLPFVRRPTGGATLVHDRELTYALALPLAIAGHRRGAEWLGRMHGVVAEALGRLGAVVRLVGPAERRKLGEVLCFLDQTPCDLVAAGHKVVGSAQRKHKSALLQHGGILLARSDSTPALPGLHELTGFPAEGFEGLEHEIVAGLQVREGWQITPGEWTAAEAKRREELMRTKYSHPSWNMKR
jgi:lipoate-protein ligase A